MYYFQTDGMTQGVMSTCIVHVRERQRSVVIYKQIGVGACISNMFIGKKNKHTCPISTCIVNLPWYKDTCNVFAMYM